MKLLLFILCLQTCLQGYITSENAHDEAEYNDSFEDKSLTLAEEDDNEVEEHPCASVHCGPGRVCDEGVCVCIEECAVEQDHRRWVCSNENTTFHSDCELHKQRCLCEQDSDDCIANKNRHLSIEYYGECRKMSDCSEHELQTFPSRMRQWLFSVMNDLADKQEMSDYYTELKRQAETKNSNRWSVAAVWRWCDLDQHPHDNIVSRHELFPLRAPLQSLEHCISPFLNSCDKDDDHSITLQEWADCLELPIEDLMNKCEQIN